MAETLVSTKLLKVISSRSAGDGRSPGNPAFPDFQGHFHRHEGRPGRSNVADPHSLRSQWRVYSLASRTEIMPASRGHCVPSLHRHKALTPDEVPIMIRTANGARCEFWPDPLPRPEQSTHGTRRMKIDGHCHCGEITFQAEVDPDALNICHCTDCQTLSGTAFRVNIPAPADHFVLLSGTPKTYVKTAESGNKRLHAFCGSFRSMPVRWTIRRAMACVSGQLHSAPPSHRSDKAGGVLRCIGWMRSPLCPRPRKGGQAKQRSLHVAAASPDALPATRYSATDLDEDLSGRPSFGIGESPWHQL
jgi:hypothetical protein